MTAISRQALVGDIGGTNARFAIADIDELAISDFAVFRCDMFGSLQEAVSAYLDSVPQRPAMAAFAIAGPLAGAVAGPMAGQVADEPIRLTNRPWTFTANELKAACGVQHLHLVNDFEALALSLPSLTGHDLHRICGGTPVDRATKVVVGPGTGLGVGALVDSPGGWVSVGGEGGHVSFGAQTAAELRIVEHVGRGGEHVSAERLISGSGIARIYKALAGIGGEEAGLDSPAEIVEHALAHDDPLAEQALGYFVKWLGRYAGDLALIHGARGGVYIGGGVAPRILDALAGDAFATAFRSKGRLSAYLEPIPVYVIKAADAGLRGAAVALSASLAAAGK